MNKGILIFGPNGTGKSTLTHIAAKITDYFAMDVEDYYFPEQAAARQAYIDGEVTALDCVQFVEARTKSEVCRDMLADIEKHPRFMLCSVRADWDNAILERIALAFFVNTPMNIRLERIAQRDMRRLGRVQEDFRRMVMERGEMTAADAGNRLTCPVIELDGCVPPEVNAVKIAEYINAGAF